MFTLRINGLAYAFSRGKVAVRLADRLAARNPGTTVAVFSPCGLAYRVSVRGGQTNRVSY
jgi:hypothetical protein